jgi:hypothetical protein
VTSLLAIGIGVAFVETLLVTLRLVVLGDRYPKNRFVEMATRNEWCLSLIFFVPITIGRFAREELSPLPWRAYSEAAARHGWTDGLFSLSLVLMIDLWLLWIPADLYVRKRPTIDRRIKILARSLNLAIGLLLMSPRNPLYAMLGR